MYDVVLLRYHAILAEIDDGYWISRKLRHAKVYPIPMHTFNEGVYPDWIVKVVENYGYILPFPEIERLVIKAKQMNGQEDA